MFHGRAIWDGDEVFFVPQTKKTVLGREFVEVLGLKIYRDVFPEDVTFDEFELRRRNQLAAARRRTKLCS